MAKSKTFWITRDSDSDMSDYEVWLYRDFPQKNSRDGYGAGCMYEFCRDDFEHFTGITLAPGQKVKARIVIGE